MVLLECTFDQLIARLLTLFFKSGGTGRVPPTALLIKIPIFSHLFAAYYLIARLTSSVSSASPTILSLVVPSALRFSTNQTHEQDALRP